MDQNALARLIPGRPPRLFGSGLTRASRQQPFDFRPNPLGLSAEILQYVGGNALSLDAQTEEDVVCAHVPVSHAATFLERDLDDLLHSGGWDDLLDDDAFVFAESGFDGRSEDCDFNSQIG